jgi:hypothetical protein
MLDLSVQYLSADDAIAVHSRILFTATTYSKSVETGFVAIYTVRDGLIVKLDVYYKDPSAVAALFDV